jgi:hypothetical protein
VSLALLADGDSEHRIALIGLQSQTLRFSIEQQRIARQPGRQILNRSIMIVALAVIAIPSTAAATTPRNPDRLNKIIDCKSALRELVTAAQGSPLRSAAKNQDYLARVFEQANRFCTDANPPLIPAR